MTTVFQHQLTLEGYDEGSRPQSQAKHHHPGPVDDEPLATEMLTETMKGIQPQGTEISLKSLRTESWHRLPYELSCRRWPRLPFSLPS
jgi:hypothetical protein